MQELSGTKAYEQTSEKEKSAINNHIFHNATRFAVMLMKTKRDLAGDHLFGKLLFTWLSLVMSMMVSFVLSFFPRDVLDEILNLIGSVSEGFPSYSSYILLAT